jgi:hypothetical protein
MKSHRPFIVAAVVALLLVCRPVAAHVGSPGVFLDAQAGPFRLFVTIRPPRVVPGVAEVEVLAAADDVQEVRIVPLPLSGPGAEFAPASDVAARSRDDPRLFTGQLWMMTAGAWQVRVAAKGARGEGVVAVPVSALPAATLDMAPTRRAVLFSMMLLLCAGFVSIASALAREAHLPPGEMPARRDRRRGTIAAAAATGVVIAVIVFGNRWWSAEAASYARYVYKPLEAYTAVTPDRRLNLSVRDPGWLAFRRIDDFIRDHGYLMHLFVVSPTLDRFWHLHPEDTGNGTFEQRLPDGPAGTYEVFADVVHGTGLSETLTSQFVLPDGNGHPLVGDDSVWSRPSSGVAADTAPLPDGGAMTWLRDGKPLAAGRLTTFSFRVDDANGRPAADMELYMGMPGHAIFISHDRRVFAHVHPSGSAPMAALEIGRRSLDGDTPAVAQDHVHSVEKLPAVVTFPFGLPERGDYRIFVQVKRAGRIHTGAFDVRVD